MLMIKIKHKVRTAVLTDPSKEPDCLNDDIFVAKLHVFDFNYKSLRDTYAHLSNRAQVTKVGSLFGELLDIIFGVPKDSILDTSLFNTNIIDDCLI